MKAKNVIPLTGYKLQVEFEDGISGTVDLAKFIQGGIFSSLKDKELFNKVYTNGYSIAWNDELEIDSLTVYKEILNQDQKNF